MRCQTGLWRTAAPVSHHGQRRVHAHSATPLRWKATPPTAAVRLIATKRRRHDEDPQQYRRRLAMSIVFLGCRVREEGVSDGARRKEVDKAVDSAGRNSRRGQTSRTPRRRQEVEQRCRPHWREDGRPPPRWTCAGPMQQRVERHPSRDATGNSMLHDRPLPSPDDRRDLDQRVRARMRRRAECPAGSGGSREGLRRSVLKLAVYRNEGSRMTSCLRHFKRMSFLTDFTPPTLRATWTAVVSGLRAHEAAQLDTP